VYCGLKFVSGYGLNCHLDSLVITSTDIEEPYPDFTVSERIIAAGDTVVFTDNSFNGPYTYYDWDFGYSADPATATGPGPHMVVYDSTGYASISLTLDSNYKETKINYLLIDNYVHYIPFNLKAQVDLADVYLNWNWKSFEDGFETEDFRLWGNVIEGPGVGNEEGQYGYWHVENDPGFASSGSSFAIVDWGYNLDSWLISPKIQVTQFSRIEFDWTSNYDYNVGNGNGDLTVEISTDDGISWNTLWTFTEIGSWFNWTWYTTSLDIGGYAGQEVLIAFHVVGNDNADILIDEVNVNNVMKKESSIKTSISDKRTYINKGRQIPQTDQTKMIVPEKTASLSNYSIYRNGELAGTSTTTSYIDEGLSKGTYYYYIIGNYINPEYSTKPSDTIQIVITYDDIAGNKAATSVLFYPNPSYGNFFIETEKAYHLEIKDIAGNSIKEMEIPAATSSIDISDHPEGIYLFFFRNDEANFVLRGCVQRK
jgi:hypothetical protein